MTGFEFDYLTYFRNMAFVIGLIALLSFILVKLKSGRVAPILKQWLSTAPPISSDKKIKVLERITLEARKGLYLIEVWNQVWLIGTTDTDIRLIGKLEDKTTEPKPFAEYLKDEPQN